MTPPDFDKLAAKVAKAAGFKPDQIGYIQICAAAKKAMISVWNAALDAGAADPWVTATKLRAKKLPTGA